MSSSTMRIASRAIATPSLEDAKPGASLTTTVLPEGLHPPAGGPGQTFGSLLAEDHL